MIVQIKLIALQVSEFLNLKTSGKYALEMTKKNAVPKSITENALV